MPVERLLVVDDEQAIRDLLRVALSAEGYEVLEACDGGQAIHAILQEKLDGVLLDLSLPDQDGIAVTREIRRHSSVPILFVSVTEEERVKIQALDAGADDYLGKPFSLFELLARLRAALRRKHAVLQADALKLNRLRLDPLSRQIHLNGENVSLTRNEFALLEILLRHQGGVVSHHNLLKEVWGQGWEDDLHLLRVNIYNIRKKMDFEAAGCSLKNAQGIGYRLVSLEEA